MKSLDVLNSYSKHKGTLSSLLESRAEKNLEKESLVFELERQWTWAQFQSWVAGISSWLASKAKKGDKIAILSRNSDLYVGLLYAIADQGMIAVPINPDLNNMECNFILAHSDAALVFVESEFHVHAQNSLQNLQVEIHVLDESLLGKQAPALSHKGHAEDLFLILYTSGTTGFPKGVMHTQKTAVMAGEAFVERMLLNPFDRLFCILPFFHINALFYSLMGSFAAGATLLVTRKFSASQFWKLASSLEATQVNIIAAVGNILAQRDRKEFCTHKIQKVYGAPVTAQIEKVFKNDFKIPITLEGYGMTEIPGAVNNQLKGKWKVGTMGVEAKHPNPEIKFTELRIIEENEKHTKDGEVGELVVKTPLLMKGYYKDPEQTKASFTHDGWFKTGDLVKKDDEGFYVFVARKKDIIRVRGENISGAEVDRIVAQHPKVAECAAIGVPSALGEEELYLAVVPREKERLSEKDIHDWCSQHLSRVKCPKYIKLFSTLPHTPTARVAKFKLKQDPELMRDVVEF